MVSGSIPGDGIFNFIFSIWKEFAVERVCLRRKLLKSRSGGQEGGVREMVRHGRRGVV